MSTAHQVSTLAEIAPFDQEVQSLMARMAALESALQMASLRAAMNAAPRVGSTELCGTVGSNPAVSSHELKTLQTFDLSVTGRSIDQVGKAYYTDALEELLTYTRALSTFRQTSREGGENLQPKNYRDELITAKLVVGALTWGAALGTVLSATYLATWMAVTVFTGLGVLTSLATISLGLTVMGGGLLLGLVTAVAVAGSLAGAAAATAAAVGLGVVAVVLIGDVIVGDEIAAGVAAAGFAGLAVAGLGAAVGMGIAGGIGTLALLGAGTYVTMAGLAALAVSGTAFLVSAFVGLPLGLGVTALFVTAWAGLTIAETVMYGISASKMHAAAKDYRAFLQSHGRTSDLDMLGAKALKQEGDMNMVVAILNPISLGLVGVFGGVIVQDLLDDWAARQRRFILSKYGTYENFIQSKLDEVFAKNISPQMALMATDMLLKNQSLDRVILLASVAVDSVMAYALGKIQLSRLGMAVSHKSTVYDRMLGTLDMSGNYVHSWGLTTFYSDRVAGRYLGGTQYITTFGWFNSASASVDGRWRNQLQYQDGYADTTLDLSDQLVALDSRRGTSLTRRSGVSMASGNDTVLAGVVGLNVDGGAGNDGVDYSNLVFGKWTQGFAAADLSNDGHRMLMVEANAAGTGYDVTKGSTTRSLFFGEEVTKNTQVQRGKKRETVTTLGFTLTAQALQVKDSLSNVEWIKGSRYNDVMQGLNAQYNTFMGGDGNDVLKGGNAGNALSGGAGNDTLVGGSGDDYFFSTAPESTWNPLQATNPGSKFRGRYVLLRLDQRYANASTTNVSDKLDLASFRCLINGSWVQAQSVKTSEAGTSRNFQYIQFDLGGEYDVSTIRLNYRDVSFMAYLGCLDMSAIGGDQQMLDQMPGVFSGGTGTTFKTWRTAELGARSPSWTILIPHVGLTYKTGADDSDSIEGGDGKNMVSYQALSHELWRKGAGTQGADLGIAVNMALGTVKKLAHQASAAGAFTDRLNNIQTVEGTAASDSFVANDLTGNNFLGLAGADTLLGGRSADYLDGGEGDDLIGAGAGDDVILTGAGKDVVDAGLGDDTISVAHAPVLRTRYLYLRSKDWAENLTPATLSLKEIEVKGRRSDHSGDTRNLMATAASVKVWNGSTFSSVNAFNDGLYNDHGIQASSGDAAVGVYIDLGAEYDVSSISLLAASKTDMAQSQSRLIDAFASLTDFSAKLGNTSQLLAHPNMGMVRQSAKIRANYIMLRTDAPLNARMVANLADQITVNGVKINGKHPDGSAFLGVAGVGSFSSSYWCAFRFTRTVDIATIKLDLAVNAAIYLSEENYTDYLRGSNEAYTVSDRYNLDDAFKGKKYFYQTGSKGVLLTAADIDPSLSQSSFTAWDFRTASGVAIAQQPTAWSDNKYLDGGAGSDTVRYDDLGDGLRRSNNWGVQVDLQQGVARFLGQASDTTDTLVSIENAIGTEADDHLRGTQGDNRLQGVGGNDTLDGGAGNDVLMAGTGRNVLLGGSGDDVLAIKNGFQTTARYVLVHKMPGTGQLALQDLVVMSGGKNVAGTGVLTRTDGWWLLDLGQSTPIDAVQLIRTTDSPATLRQGTHVGVFLSQTALDPVSQTYAALSSNSEVLKYEESQTIRGRYVMVRRTTADHLSLAELQVWSGGANVASKAQTVTSSDRTWDAGGSGGWHAADNLTDGDTTINSGVYASKLSSGSSWVMLDLGKAYDIDRIQLFSRTDHPSQSNNLQVLVSATLDMSTQMAGAGNDAAGRLLGRDDVHWTPYSSSVDGNRSITRSDFKNTDNTLPATVTLTAADWLGSVNWQSPPSALVALGSQFDGGEGSDTLSLAGSLMEWRRASGVGAQVNLLTGMLKEGPHTATDSTLVGIEHITGTIGDDHLVGDDGDNLLNGDAGDDLIEGGKGSDVLSGGGGRDTLLGDEGDDKLYAGSTPLRGRYVLVRHTAPDGLSLAEAQVWSKGVNVAAGATLSMSADGTWDLSGHDLSNLTDGKTHAASGVYASKLRDGSSWVMLDLGQVHDIDSIQLWGRTDSWKSQSENLKVFVASTNLAATNGMEAALLSLPDLYVARFSGSTDSGLSLASTQFGLFNTAPQIGHKFVGGSGNDTLSYLRADVDSRLLSGMGILADLTAMSVVSQWSPSEPARFSPIDLLSGIENLQGSVGHDRLVGDVDANQLYGDRGNDTLLGQEGDDLIHGGSGNDLLDGGDGDDVLYSGGGQDTLLGGHGNDVLLVQHEASVLRARYVLVRKNPNSPTRLAFDEIEVFSKGINVARAATLKVSRDGSHDDGWHDEANAIDGYTDSALGAWKGHGIYASGAARGLSWVQLDLGAEFDIDAIHIIGRNDQDFEQSGNLGVFLSAADMTVNHLADRYDDLKRMDGTMWSESRTMLRGRYVLVRRTTADQLSLAELQVWSGGTNVARNARVVTSADGTWTAGDSGPGHAASNLTDGDISIRRGVYASKGKDGNSWVMLDLGQTFEIDQIQLWSRTDQAGQSNNLQVMLASTDLASTNGAYGELMKVPDLFVASFSASTDNGKALALGRGFSQVNSRWNLTQFNQPLRGTTDFLSRQAKQLTSVELALNKLDQIKTLDGGSGLQDLVSFAGENTAERLATAVNGRAAYGVYASLADGFFDNAWREGDTLLERSGTLANLEGVIGTQFGDALIGDARDNILSGGEGDDRIEGGEANDVLVGGLGRDTLLGGDGDDTFVMGESRQFTPVRYLLLRTGAAGAQSLALSGMRVLDLHGRNLLDPSNKSVTLTQSGTATEAALRDNLEGTVFGLSSTDAPSWVQIDLGQATFLSAVEISSLAGSGLTVYASDQSLSDRSDALLQSDARSALFLNVGGASGTQRWDMSRFMAVDALGKSFTPLKAGAGDSVDGGNGTDVLDYSQKYADLRQQMNAGIAVHLSTHGNGQAQGTVRDGLALVGMGLAQETFNAFGSPDVSAPRAGLVADFDRRIGVPLGDAASAQSPGFVWTTSSQSGASATAGPAGQGTAMLFNPAAGLTSANAVGATWSDPSTRPLNLRADFTLSADVRFDSTDSWARIFDFGNGAGQDNVVLSRMGSTNQLAFFVLNGSTRVLSLATTDGPIVNGQWMNVTVTYDNATQDARIYVNGQLTAQGKASAPVAAVLRSNAYIGRSHWATDGAFRGAMDDIAVYDRALDAPEVKRLSERKGLAVAQEWGVDTVSGVEQILGTDAADSLAITGSAAMAFRGQAGNDTLMGGDGNDTLNGGEGTDLLMGGKGDDTLIESSKLPVLQGRYLMLRGVTLGAQDIQIRINGQLVTGAVSTGSSAGEPQWQLDLGESRVIDRLELSLHSGLSWTSAQAQAISVFVANTSMQGISSAYLRANVNVARHLGATDTNPGGSLVTSREFLATEFEVANQTGDGVWNAYVKLGTLKANDTLDGGDGNDWLRLDESSVGARAMAGRGVLADLSAQTLNLWWQLGEAAVSERFSPTLRSIENVRGTLQNDHMVGNDANNVLMGDAGQDTLSGGAGEDILVDGSGSDVLDGEAGNDVLMLTSPVDARGQALLQARYVLVRKAASSATTDRGLALNGVTVRGSGQQLQGTVSVSDGVALDGAYTSTRSDGSSWYLVDLGQLETIDSVQVLGTGTSGSQDLQVFLAQSLPTGSTVEELLQRGDVAQTSLSTAGGLLRSENFWRWSAGGHYGLGLLEQDTVKGGDGRDMLSFAQSENAQRLQGTVKHGVWVDLAQQKAVSWWKAADGVNPDTSASPVLSDIEDVQGSVGDDYLIGSSQANTLYGGRGNDTLIGAGGGDIYFFGRADGRDVITQMQANDLIAFNSEVSADGIWLSKSGNDLLIRVLGQDGGQVTVVDFLNSDPRKKMAGIRFSDGRGLNYDGINLLVEAMAQARVPAAGVTTIPPSYTGLLNALATNLR